MLLLQTASIGPTMWDIVIQVLGTFGLAATIVGFIYVVTNRDTFTNFEEVFFLTAGSFEMLGKVVFLFGLWIATEDNFSLKVLKSLIKDPVHNMASAKESAFNFDYDDGWENYVAVFSFSPFLSFIFCATLGCVLPGVGSIVRRTGGVCLLYTSPSPRDA